MGTDSVIFIRTDGNSRIATGHLVRSLCIAQALESLGKKVIFLVSGEESHTLLKELSSSVFAGSDFSYQTIRFKNAQYDNLNKELPELIKLLSSYPSPVLYIDSYFVTPDYFHALKPYAKLAYMDDLRLFDYDADLVINYDVIPPNMQLSYEQSYTKAGKCLLGAMYTPLRPQFHNQEYSLRNTVRNLLITTGGSDPFDFCGTLVPFLLREYQEITLHIIVGKLFSKTTVTTLEKLTSDSPYVKLYKNVSDMVSLMKQCDIAISAAGTTLYELCTLGIPAISFTFADNQITIAETFDQAGVVSYAGDLRQNPSKNSAKTETVIDKINIRIKELTSNLPKRYEMHQNMKALVNGNGTMEIAKTLCRLA